MSVSQIVGGIGVGMRTFIAIQVATLLNFTIVHALIGAQNVSSFFDALFVVVQVLCIVTECAITAAAASAPAGLHLLLVFSGLAVIQSGFECFRVFSPSSYAWESAFFAIYYIVLNGLVFATAAYLRFAPSWDAWDTVVAEYDGLGAVFSKRYARMSDVVQRRAVVAVLVEFLAPAECVTLLVYFITIGVLGPDDYNITGWVYALHVFGVIAAVIWYEQTRRFRTRSKRLAEMLPPSLQGMGSVYALLFVLEGAQLVYVQSNDHYQLVVIRAFLCVASGMYVLVIAALEFEYGLVPRPIMLYYGIQMVISLVAVIDAAWMVAYFCYADAVGAKYIYQNLAHSVTVATALALVFVAEKPLDALAAMGVVATIVLCVDIVSVGVVAIEDRTSVEIFVEVVFLLISVAYVATAGVLWPGSSDADGEAYMAMREREYATAQTLADMFVGSYVDPQTLDTNEKVSAWYLRVARRMHYVITCLIKTTGVADIIFVISYTIILAVKTEFGPQPQWYQWWYMFHYLSASAAFLLSTLALGIQTPLMFLFVVAVACLIIDCVLMGYLAGLVTAGEISIQAFFIAIDLLYLVFFFMTTVNAEPTSFALLVHMARSGTYARLTRQKHTD